jgi:hypothetical protein
MDGCLNCAMGLIPHNGQHSVATDAGYETVPCTATARQLAEHDRKMFGNGFVRKHSDGREEYIPADQVMILPGKGFIVSNPT